MGYFVVTCATLLLLVIVARRLYLGIWLRKRGWEKQFISSPGGGYHQWVKQDIEGHFGTMDAVDKENMLASINWYPPPPSTGNWR